MVGYHAAPGRVPGGFIGVDVFFVISGFLITAIIVRDHEDDRFSFSTFYARRCRRILPALFVVLIAALAIGWRTLLSPEFDALARDIIAGATFTTNVVVWRNFGYFADAAGYTPLLHLWSLAVEEQFYILWPVALVLLLRRRGPWATLAAIAAAASFILNVWIVRRHSVMTFYLLPTRFWELMIGAVVASAASQSHIRNWSRRRSFAEVVVVLALASVAMAAFLFAPDSDYPGWRALIPTLAAAAVLAFGNSSRIARLCLSNPTAVSIGLVSYPLYLWHWPLLSFAHIWQIGIVPHATRLMLVGLSFLLAYV
ncbi:MAG TPA: acyltransferase, partial [Vicinamibacterales bacterium]